MTKKTLLFQLFDNSLLAESLLRHGQFERGECLFHPFPDEETLVTITSDVKNRRLLFLASLDRPNSKILPLLFAAKTARAMGAKEIILVAPYLAYMRQDTVFAPGQGVTSAYFAQLLSGIFDGLITVDPHLHRWHTLQEIYTIPTTVIHAAEPVSLWIKHNINNPVLIGPDEESGQWIKAIAKLAGVPFQVLHKTRAGDKQVLITDPTLQPEKAVTPVIMDDIISSGVTMLETIKILKKLNMPPPVCIGVHAVFAGDSYNELLNAGAREIVTCNTIEHVSNKIDLGSVIAKKIIQM